MTLRYNGSFVVSDFVITGVYVYDQMDTVDLMTCQNSDRPIVRGQGVSKPPLEVLLIPLLSLSGHVPRKTANFSQYSQGHLL